MTGRYTGPTWVGPLFAALAAGFVFKVLVNIFMDTEAQFRGPDGTLYGMAPKGER